MISKSTHAQAGHLRVFHEACSALARVTVVVKGDEALAINGHQRRAGNVGVASSVQLHGARRGMGFNLLPLLHLPLSLDSYPSFSCGSLLPPVCLSISRAWHQSGKASRCTASLAVHHKRISFELHCSCNCGTSQQLDTSLGSVHSM